MPKVTQEYRDARRDQILEAARRCFHRDGFHATSMQDLFAEAGLSSGAVYRYYQSKDDLIIAIAEDNMREVVEMIQTVTAQDPESSIGSVLASILDRVEAKNVESGLGALAILVWAEALRNPAVAQRFSALLLTMRASLADVVRDHERRRGVPADVPADALSALLLSILPGYMLQLVLLGPESVAEVPDAARTIWS